MSLTREEWLCLWQEIKNIERINNNNNFSANRFRTVGDPIKLSIEAIKSKIQQVVGQLE